MAGAPTTTATLRDVASHWDDTQGTVQVDTPDRSMDIMLNRWLIYQTLACRLWARAAFYQAGGAYGFRDQLQDVIALVDRQARSSPASTCCGRRPTSSSKATSSTGGTRRRDGACEPGSRTTACGCRTRSIATSPSPATRAVLDEIVPFLEGPALRAGQTDAYFQPERSARVGARCSSTAPRAHRPQPRRSARTACR